MSGSKSIVYQVSNRIGTLTLNRPRHRNALDFEAQEAFAAQIDEIEKNAPNVLIIRGSGNRAFSAGADIHELSDHLDQSSGVKLKNIMSQALGKLPHLPSIVIGSVNGDAAGGGVEILSACDLRISADHARFMFAHLNMGLTPLWGGSARLLHLLSSSVWADLAFNAQTIDAARAQRIGFVHRLVPSDDLEHATRVWARELAERPRNAAFLLKQMLWLDYYRDEKMFSHEQVETQAAKVLYGSQEHRDAIQRFQTRPRKPKDPAPKKATKGGKSPLKPK